MTTDFDLICLSHLPWDLVYQRPQHLMSRFARERRVFYVEEAIYDANRPRLEVRDLPGGPQVVIPHLPPGTDEKAGSAAQRELLDDFLDRQEIRRYALWYYTPMALAFSDHLTPVGVIYDCMDELSAFALAPRPLQLRERELFAWTDAVFTGGQSLYEAKRSRHPSVHCFPSSVDVRHFAQARDSQEEPPDQAVIPGPRIGFYGVLDERMDLDLLRGVADARPDWQLVVVGPYAEPKFDPAVLPYRKNIHYLGPKPYDELPAYLAGWDVAMLPFARNESTRFISPTKTPEYLAAGRPVVSTSIHDVVNPYGTLGLIRVADTPRDFVAAIEAALMEGAGARQESVDAFLKDMSWDQTWTRMNDLVQSVVTPRLDGTTVSTPAGSNAVVEVETRV